MSHQSEFCTDAFLHFVSRECSLFLYLHWNAGEQARRAALLSLHGAGLGFWRLSKNDFRAACEVAGTRSDISTIRAIRKPKGKCNAATCLQACEELEAAFAGETDDAARLNAIEAFFSLIGWITAGDLATAIKEKELAS